MAQVGVWRGRSDAAGTCRSWSRSLTASRRRTRTRGHLGLVCGQPGGRAVALDAGDRRRQHRRGRSTARRSASCAARRSARRSRRSAPPARRSGLLRRVAVDVSVRRHLVQPGPADRVGPRVPDGAAALVARAGRSPLAAERVGGVQAPQSAVVADPGGVRVDEDRRPRPGGARADRDAVAAPIVDVRDADAELRRGRGSTATASTETRSPPRTPGRPPAAVRVPDSRRAGRHPSASRRRRSPPDGCRRSR